VRFDPQAQLLEIKGESYPENAFAFYQPLIEWIVGYLAIAGAPVLLQLHLTYLNTSSTRCLLALLDQCEAAHRAGSPVAVHWFYHPDDDRSLEAGEEFGEDLTLPFTIMAVPETSGEGSVG
jgi:hypothetical protein